MAIDILSIVTVAKTPEERAAQALAIHQQIQALADGYANKPWAAPASYVPPLPKPPDPNAIIRKQAYHEGIIRGLEMALELHGVGGSNGDLLLALDELKRFFEKN